MENKSSLLVTSNNSSVPWLQKTYSVSFLVARSLSIYISLISSPLTLHIYISLSFVSISSQLYSSCFFSLSYLSICSHSSLKASPLFRVSLFSVFVLLALPLPLLFSLSTFAPNNTDADYIDDFLISYRYFLTPTQLMSHLETRYEYLPTGFENEEEIKRRKQWEGPIRLRSDQTPSSYSCCCCYSSSYL